MPEQNDRISRTEKQNSILDLEQKYFDEIEKIILSSTFQHDLLLIEKETEENYPKYRDVWKLKDKIKVPVERLIRQHVYLSFVTKIKGIYPSPISSDLGIRLNDAVLCIDAKTIDTNGNAGDLRSTSAEQNQTSFNNKNYPYITTQSNLESIDHYSRLPVLTYVIKVVYHDDKTHFRLERGKYPSLVLTCIPNGELSNLFEYDAIDNFKTYNYYEDSDGLYYKHKLIPRFDHKDELKEYMKDRFEVEMGWTRVFSTNFNSEYIYYDIAKQQLWWMTSNKNKIVLAPVKSGNTARFNNNILKNRKNSLNQKWQGYKEYQLPPALPNASQVHY